MAKKAAWPIIIALLFAQVPVEAFTLPNDNSRNPSAAKGLSDDPAYLATKAALHAPDKKSDASLSESVSLTVAKAVASLGALVRRNTAPGNVPQRGDPKTTFSQSENRFHSARQLPPPPPPPDPTPEPEPTPTPEPEPSPEPSPEPLLDLTKWSVANTYQSGIYELSVYFKAAEDGLYDVVLVVYDTTTGQALQAIGYRTQTVYDMPDISGFTLVTTVRREDGSWSEKYALLGAGSTSWEDVSTWIEIEFDATDMFVFATIKTIESLLLETLALPPLHSIVF